MLGLLCVLLVFFGHTVRPVVVYTMLFFGVLSVGALSAPLVGVVSFLLWLGVEMGIAKVGSINRVYGQVGGYMFAIQRMGA